ncbi:MAG: hypothetical protein KJN71_08100 [Acidimicrobiia bacterium]|nr:hypothetical protein [Acidimicrobiia bacterium]
MHVSDTWKYAAGIAICAVFAWIAFVQVERIPLLGYADLGFHELGHLVMYMFPISEILTAAMGSIFQVAIPGGLAAYFWFKRHDRFATTVTLAWGAASARDVAVYVADAPVRALPLLGGDNVTHDWWFILGRFDALDQAGALANLITVLGFITLLGAATLCALALIDLHGWRLRRQPDLSGLPVREVRPPRG